MAKVRQRKRDMVNREIDFHLQQYKTTGTELIMGTGRFVAPKTLEVHLNDGGTRELAGDQVFINVGTHAAIPSVPGLEAARPLTHIEALELDYLPPHLIVLGGGYIGLELAQAYHRFGSRVTIIQSGPQLMSREDPDVADEMQRILSDEGIQILVAAEPLNVHGQTGKEVSVTVHTTSGEQKIEGSDILVAAGRIPNTAGIGLEKAGVELMIVATFASMNGWRRLRPVSGRWGNPPVAYSSHTYPWTTFESSGIIWLEGSAARAIGWSHTACSRTLHSPTWD
jgi:pyruvate/2-oxoglutarate dehydrogenase complex dihydrolipoamide dehydrogenase (E3) component